MHDMDGALTRQYGVLGRMAAGVQTTEESPGSTEQGARRKPGKRGNALTVPRKRAGGQPPESNRNVPDASAGRMKRAILPAAISDPVARSRFRLLTVVRRDRKSRAAAKATTRPVPVRRGGERWSSAQQCVNRTRLTRLTLLMHCGASSSIGRAPACGAGCYGFEPREAPHSSSSLVFLARS